MPIVLFLLLGGAVAAGIALSRKGVPAEVSASMADMMAKYTVVGPHGERAFKPDVALGISRTLAGQLYSYVDQTDRTRITIKADPHGAPPSPDLSALGWARAQNETLAIMAPVYMAESTSAQRFLEAVAPGRESSDGGQLYAVLAYAGVLAKNGALPGNVAAPGTLPPPKVAPTPLATAQDTEVPPDLMALYTKLLQTGSDPTILIATAAQLDAVGLHTAAELLRKRAASLSAVTPAKLPVLPPAPAPAPRPAHAVPTPGPIVHTPSGPLQQTPAGPAVVVPTPTGPATVVMSAVQKAATAMNLLLNAHGYKQADQPVYRAFQQAAGLKPDGFPGPNTMSSLQSVLGSMGVATAAVRIYPWKATGVYDGVNAPTQAEWSGAQSMPPTQLAPGGSTLQQVQQQLSALNPAAIPASYSVPSGPSAPPGSSPAQIAAVAMSSSLGSYGYRKRDQAIYKAYQSSVGLSADGFPGPGTMGSLNATLASMGMTPPPVTIYPWKSSGAYDGVNAPSAAQWNS